MKEQLPKTLTLGMLQDSLATIREAFISADLLYRKPGGDQ